LLGKCSGLGCFDQVCVEAPWGKIILSSVLAESQPLDAASGFEVC